jgi:hypothetical protein
MQKAKAELRIRPLQEQFPKQTVRRIRTLQLDLASLPFRDGAGRFYAKELERSLEAGLLLASLYLATSLLELFVRDLLIYDDAHDSASGNRNEKVRVLDNLEKYYEDAARPQWSFSKLVIELGMRRIIDDSDVATIKEFYEEIRVPIHHGLTRRFLRGERESESLDTLEDLFNGIFLWRNSRERMIENRLEGEAIDLIAVAIAFVKKYSRFLERGQSRHLEDS